MPDRRAQAAMEFLMSYGWAILVVLVVIGALAYFGVLSPANLLPEKCEFSVSVGCEDFSVGENGVSVVLQNSAGRDMKVTNIAFHSDSLAGVCDSGAIDATLRNGEKATFFANDPAGCSFADSGKSKNKYRVNVTYSWLDSGIGHVLEGELFARHEAGAVGGEGQGSFGGSGSLVGYWKFDALGSGRVIADSSGNGNDGMFTGSTNDATASGVTIAAGKYGNGAGFSGGGNVNAGSSPSLSVSGRQFTLAAWVKPDNTNNQDIIDAATYDGAWQGYGLSIANNGRFMTLYRNSAEYKDAAGPSFQAGTWYYVVQRVTATESEIWVNGVKSGGTGISAPLTFPQSALEIGHAIGLADFNGVIDEVRLYDRALSPEEITQSMNSQYPVAVPVASYSFENSGNIGSDTRFIVEDNGRKAVALDGVDDYIDAGDSATLRPGNKSMTFAAWVKPSSLGAIMDILEKGDGWDTNQGVYEWRIENSNQMRTWYQGGTATSNAFAMQANTWMFLAMVADHSAQTITFYKDGELISSHSSGVMQTANTNFESLVIGAGRINNAIVGHFNGRISDVIIYDRVLSQSEIAALAGQ